MSWVSSEAVSVLVFLLPGFVAASVFYSLTSYPKPNEFGQVIQALVFTMLGQSIAWAAISLLDAALTIGAEVIVSIISAVALALLAVYVSNNDIIHRLFRHIGMTKETSYLSEWYSSFAQNKNCYVVLHLKDGRRLYGWPEEWPSRPYQGHFRIIEAEWLSETDDSPHSEKHEIFAIVVAGEDVKMVEFLPYDTSEEANHG